MSGAGFDLSDILGVGRRDVGPIPQADAFADTLRHRFALLSERHDFKPGDLVVGKPGLTKIRDEIAHLPMLVVDIDLAGYAPLAPAEEGDATYRPDIAVLTWTEQGTTVLRLEDSRLVMPWVAPEDVA